MSRKLDCTAGSGSLGRGAHQAQSAGRHGCLRYNSQESFSGALSRHDFIVVGGGIQVRVEVESGLELEVLSAIFDLLNVRNADAPHVAARPFFAYYDQLF